MALKHLVTADAKTDLGATPAVLQNALASTTLTISSGAVTPTRASHVIAAESGTSDDLATVTTTNFKTGDQITIVPDSGDTITLKHGTGNITSDTGGDIILDAVTKYARLYVTASGVVASLGGGAGSAKIASVTALRALSPQDGQELELADGREYRWNAASTTTVNAPAVLDRAAGGTGRFILQGKVVPLEAWISVMDGTTDNATDFANAANWAKTNGYWIDGGRTSRGNRLRFASAVSLAGPGSFLWRDMPEFEGADVSANGIILTIAGEALGTGAALALTANVAARAESCTIGTGASLSAGDWVILRDDGLASGDGSATRGELLRIKTYNSGTGAVAFTTPCRGAYTTANTARLQKWFDTTSVEIDGGVLVQGGGAADLHYGVRFRRVNLKADKLVGRSCGDVTFSVELCRNPKIGRVEAYDSDGASGQQYGVEVIGCWDAEIQQVYSRNLRHGIVLSTSYSDSNHSQLMGRGAIIGSVIGDECLSNTYDSHAGYVDIQVGDIIGRMKDTVSTQEAFVIESPRTDIKSITVQGANPQSIAIYNFGSPDDLPNFVRIGSLSGDAHDNATWSALLMNRDDKDRKPFTVDIGSAVIGGAYGLQVYPEEGDIFINIGTLSLRARNGHGLYARSTVNGRSRVSVDMIDVDDITSSSSNFPVYADGTDWEAANANSPGAYIDIRAGRIKKASGGGGYGIRASDGVVNIGPTVLVDAPNKTFREGVGKIFFTETVREVLTDNQNLYMNGSGNDNNDGRGSGSSSAVLTFSRLMAIAAAIDSNGYDIICNVSDATRTEQVVLPAVFGGGRIILRGNTSSPASNVINVTGANAIDGTNADGRYLIEGFTLSTVTSGHLLYAAGPRAFVEFKDLVLGAAPSSSKLFADVGATISAVGNYSHTGNADRLHYALHRGMINIASRTLTATSSPVYAAGGFAVAGRGGVCRLTSNTYSGSVGAGTKQFDAFENGTVVRGGATLPGDTTGTTATGGQSN